MNNKTIKPGSGEMIDEEVQVSYQSSEYTGIEKKVKAEMFYDFLHLRRGDTFENDESTVLISIAHYTLMQKMRTHIMKIKKSDMVRGLVGLGIIAHAKQRNIAADSVNALITINRYERKVEMNKRFDKSMSRLKFDDEKTKKALKYIIKRHGNNKYGEKLWVKLFNPWDMPKIDFEESEIHIPNNVIETCKTMTKKHLKDDMFALKKEHQMNADAKNMPLCLTISNRFLVIQDEYTKLFMPDKMRGQMLRGFLVTGLHILAKWVIAGKVSKLEYDFGKLIGAMDKAASAY